jgi:peptide/nickel transport system permease protein
MGVALIGASFQIYFFGIVAQYIFVDQLQLLPQPGYTPLTQNLGQWFGGMLLPWITLAVVNAAFYARYTRSSMLEALAEDYIRTVRAKGLRPWSIYAKHAWRGAMTPIVTLFGMDLGALLGGALITETTFDIHGVGQLAVQSVDNLDLPMIVGTVLIAAAAVLAMNVVVDAGYALIDPRVRTR